MSTVLLYTPPRVNETKQHTPPRGLLSKFRRSSRIRVSLASLMPLSKMTPQNTTHWGFFLTLSILKTLIKGAVVFSRGVMLSKLLRLKCAKRHPGEFPRFQQTHGLRPNRFQLLLNRTVTHRVPSWPRNAWIRTHLPEYKSKHYKSNQYLRTYRG